MSDRGPTGDATGGANITVDAVPTNGSHVTADISLGTRLMTGQAQSQAGQPDTADAASAEPPVTGNAQVDRILGELRELNQLDLAERAEQLSAAQQHLQAVLDSSREPGVPMPRPDSD